MSVFTPKSPFSLARLSQMRLQDLIDQGQVNSGSVPKGLLNRSQIMSDFEISLVGILELLSSLRPDKELAHMPSNQYC